MSLLNHPSILGWRLLPDGRRLDVIALWGGRARLCVSPAADSLFYEDGW